MNSYSRVITLDVDKNAVVKTFNDQILAGINKGFSDFWVKVKSGRTYSNICAPIAGILDYYRDKDIRFEFEYDNNNKYIEHTKFSDPLIVEDYIDKGSINNPLDVVWKFSSSEAVHELVKAYILELRQADVVENGVISSMEWCINETLDNVLQHSNAGSGYIMAQHHKTTKQFSVCIFDSGIGIYNSLKNSIHRPQSALDAITLALQERVTRDIEVGQGNGLWGLSKIIDEAKGRLYISSCGAVYNKDFHNKEKMISWGYLNLGKNRGTTLVDFQLNYSNPIDIAKALNGYEPLDLWLENLEDTNGNVVIEIANQSGGTGTRKAAEKLRNLVLNILKNERKRIVLDFNGVNLISSSYADELIGKIIVQYGIVAFINNFEIKNMSEFNSGVLNRSVQQRMAQKYYDNKIVMDEE